MKVFCVIDVQKDFTSATRRFAIPPQEMESTISRLNHWVQEARREGIPIVYIRQINSSWMARIFSRIFTQGLGIRGNPGCQLDDRLEVVSRLIFDKEKPSSFSSPEFTAWLETKKVKSLVLAGIDGCFCVNATAREALRRGYEIELLTDAIATSFPKRWHHLQEQLVARGARIRDLSPSANPALRA